MGAELDTSLRVLVVEDEPKLADLIRRGIESQGWACAVAHRGDSALQLLAPGHEWDAIVLDRMLPGLGGVRVCERLRQRGDRTPVVMLTAMAGIDERVEGLDAGANDYLVKPFALKELYARLRAVTRSAAHVAPGPDGPPHLRHAGLHLDLATNELRGPHTTCTLRPQEAALLAQLMEAGGRPVSRSAIAEHLWAEAEFPSDNQLDVLVARLRRRLAAMPGTSLRTRRGYGYELQVDAR